MKLAAFFEYIQNVPHGRDEVRNMLKDIVRDDEVEMFFSDLDRAKPGSIIRLSDDLSRYIESNVWIPSGENVDVEEISFEIFPRT